MVLTPVAQLLQRSGYSQALSSRARSSSPRRHSSTPRRPALSKRKVVLPADIDAADLIRDPHRALEIFVGAAGATTSIDSNAGQLRATIAELKTVGDETKS